MNLQAKWVGVHEQESVSKANGSPSSPDHSQLILLTLDYTQLAYTKTNWEPVRRLGKSGLVGNFYGLILQQGLIKCNSMVLFCCQHWSDWV